MLSIPILLLSCLSHSPPPCPFPPSWPPLHSCLNNQLRHMYAAHIVMGVAILWTVVYLPYKKPNCPSASHHQLSIHLQ